MATRFGFLTTFPPTQCGLATFSAALRTALLSSHPDEGWVVELVEADAPRPTVRRSEIAARWVAGDSASMDSAVQALNACDVAIVQHEYGVYGGRDGEDVLVLLDQLDVPVIVVLHTVLSDPSTHQREVLEAVMDRADALVTMTATASARLSAYRVDRSKVSTIPHGAPDVPLSVASAVLPTFRPPRPTILTWGLMGPGKGIEWGVEAMGLLRDLEPTPQYIVAGKTHPKVLARDGEAYREELVAQVRRLGLSGSVSFDSHYRDTPALGQLVRAADVVLLPYDSTEQITSGVLIEAVSAGRPVVATAFPHAVELLADGAGIVVPNRDPLAIAQALRDVLTRPALAASMSQIAASAAPQLRWSAVAEQYRSLATGLIKARIAA
jgi:glycosyltransferase involved in cell wall biosynthesis